MGVSFNEIELLTINEVNNLSKNSTIDGVEISGFMLIYELASGKKNKSCISQSDIDDLIIQVNLERDFYLMLGGDTSIFDKIILFLMEE